MDRVAMPFAGLLLATLVPCCVYAQDIDDYKGALAMGRRECTTASIPFPDIRDAAERKQQEVTRWCKVEVRSCDGLENKKLIATINGIPDGLKNLSEALNQAKKDRESAKDSDKSSIDDKIRALGQKSDALTKELDFSKRSLETNKSDAEKRIYNGNYCVQARKDMVRPFRDAMSRAKEKGSANEALKPITDELIGIWEKCEREHEKDIRMAEEAIEYCKKCRSGDY